MAKAILSGIASADKPSSQSFNTPSVQPAFTVATSLPGPLSSSEALKPLAKLVQNSKVMLTSITHARLGHTAPPSKVTLAAKEAPDVECVKLTHSPANAAKSDAGKADAMSHALEPTPIYPGVMRIETSALEPLIFVAEQAERTSLGKEPLLQRPGMYIGLWDTKAYVGMSEKVGVRASTNPTVSGLHPAQRIICITEAQDRLTTKQALIGERLLAQVVQQSGERTLGNKLPFGAPLNPQEYDAVRLFVARACHALRNAGLLFTGLPAAALLLPPAKALPSEPMDLDTPIYAITMPNLHAQLAVLDGEWRLLRGSQIRCEVTPSAYGPASMGRAELLHSGGLLRTGPVLTLTQDLTFTSAWAAAHFVLGERPRADVWKPVGAPDASPYPRR